MWIASYVMLWVAVVVLCLAVVALLRQVGVLHARVRPMGVHFAGEGPERLKPAPAPERFSYGDTDLTLIAFTTSDCDICRGLEPGLRALGRDGGVRVHLVENSAATASVFAAFNVRSAPYMVTVDRAGIVKARGVANTLEQIEVMLEESRT